MPLPPPLVYPDRVPLARLPTPLVRLERVSERLGLEVLVKRDDQTGSELSGNKVRKLEFLLAEARAQGCDTVITCGGQQSNHARATALASARLGLQSHLVLRTADPCDPPYPAGNVLLDLMAGAHVRWIAPADWAQREELMAEAAEALRRVGRRPYVVPEGGSNALGAFGYVRAVVEELDPELCALSPCPTSVIYACGSGGTGAGLVIGASLCGWQERNIRVVGVNVCDNRDYFVRRIAAICRDFEHCNALQGLVGDQDADIVDGYVGLGYAQSRPQELRAIISLARTEGLVLDPVYTGKAYYALVQELARDPARFGRRVVFIHTGGVFGLFPFADQLVPLLREAS